MITRVNFINKMSKVGMTGFEPATTRTPCVYATRLRHIPKSDCKNINFTELKMTFSQQLEHTAQVYFPDKNSRISKLNASLASGESFKGFIKK